ncbi:MAG: hypothetical protein KC635_16205 [Myxococcales bacterium]|nr:hypothetical protein [Myxococcales bacterium]MCB9736593.1 hypothetical protein [Deltaproteobacteria bacterium]
MSGAGEALVAVHAAVHDDLEARWWRSAEALTALHLADAKVRWADFAAALARHAEREDADVLPPFFAAGEPPRGASREIMAGEHERLVALAGDTGRALGDVPDEGATRREAIDVLDQMLRVKHLLEHHGIREQELVYPRLEGLGDEVRARVLAALG